MIKKKHIVLFTFLLFSFGNHLFAQDNPDAIALVDDQLENNFYEAVKQRGIENYDKAIVVSGDGDFACLLEFLDDKNKLLHVMTPNHKYSKLLKPFSRYIVHVSQLRKSIEYKKTGIGGRSKP